LYLLDEPEAALSPIRQLGLIAMLKDMVAEDAQFIIATHSPVLLAFPDAAIFDFDQHPPVMTVYDDLPHIQFYRSFMESPESLLRRLSD
jgi:predicted ATPase